MAASKLSPICKQVKHWKKAGAKTVPCNPEVKVGDKIRVGRRKLKVLARSNGFGYGRSVALVEAP